MVIALFSLNARLDRARRQKKRAGALDILQTVAGQGSIRLSDIAVQRHVHPSLISRQVRDLEDEGYLEVTQDPSDLRSWLVNLTPVGEAEMTRLQQVGLDRFSTFVAEWEQAEVNTLSNLLEKLVSSMTTADSKEDPEPNSADQRSPNRRRRPRKRE